MYFPSPPLRVSNSFAVESSNRAITCAPAIAAPLGSVNVPLIVAVFCACAVAGTTKSVTNRNPAAMAGIPRSLMITSSPSRAGVEGCPDAPTPLACVRIRIETPPVSWLGGPAPLRSGPIPAKPGQQGGLPVPATDLDDSLRGTVARAENFRLTVARRRRLFTVFPCAESPVIVDGDRRFARSPLAAARRLPLRRRKEKIAGS